MKNSNNDSDISDEDFGDIDENIVHNKKKHANIASSGATTY